MFKVLDNLAKILFRRAIPISDDEILEVGSTYRNENGDPVEIVGYKPSRGLYVSCGFDWVASDGELYSSNGRCKDDIFGGLKLTEKLV